MTPLTRFLMKYLPHRTVGYVLALAYVAALLAVFLLIGRDPQTILYLDIGRGK